MRTFRALLALNLCSIGLLSAGLTGIVLAAVGGAWLGAELMGSSRGER